MTPLGQSESAISSFHLLLVDYLEMYSCTSFLTLSILMTMGQMLTLTLTIMTIAMPPTIISETL